MTALWCFSASVRSHRQPHPDPDSSHLPLSQLRHAMTGQQSPTHTFLAFSTVCCAEINHPRALCCPQACPKLLATSIITSRSHLYVKPPESPKSSRGTIRKVHVEPKGSTMHATTMPQSSSMRRPTLHRIRSSLSLHWHIHPYHVPRGCSSSRCCAQWTTTDFVIPALSFFI